jgi:hypothetical protein
MPVMKKALLIAAEVLLVIGLTGCTVVTKDQKEWVQDKANRSAAFATLMDQGQTSRAQEQEWIRSQNESWKLWAQKVDLGLAAPNWMADAAKQSSAVQTQPSGGDK